MELRHEIERNTKTHYPIRCLAKIKETTTTNKLLTHDDKDIRLKGSQGDENVFSFDKVFSAGVNDEFSEIRDTLEMVT